MATIPIRHRPVIRFTGRHGLLLALLALLAAALIFWWPVVRTRDPEAALDEQARRFTSLALALARTDAREVDGYFGPAALEREAAAAPPQSLADLQAALTALRNDVADGGDAASPRRRRLVDRVERLSALVGLIRKPGALRFAEEAERIYAFPMAGAADAPGRQVALRRLSALLPGEGPLAARVAAYRGRFVIPGDRREAVFRRALAECRLRTLAHWRLPPEERVEIEWTGKVAAAWHRYRGGYRSTLQVNPAAVALPGEALDVACHEGYPGHHAQFVMMEAGAGPAGLPPEERIVLLRSPDSLLREGAANYGVGLALPPDERLAFVRDVLFPLAGLPPAEAATYDEVHRLVGELGLAVLPTLAAYRDGTMPADAAAAALEREALIASPQALLGFVDALGAYAIGYTAGRDRIGAQVLARGRANCGDPWTALGDLVSRPDAAALAPPSHPS